MLLPPAPDTRDRVLHAGLRERLAMIQTILAIYAFTTAASGMTFVTTGVSHT